MEKAAVLIIFKLTQSAFTGTPSLHPPLISPPTLSHEQQREQLYGDYDRLLKDIPGYREDIMPLGIFTKPWIVEEEVPSGVLSEYVARAIREFKGIASERIATLYEENVPRFDQALISRAVYYVTQGYSYVMRKKTDILGRFPPEQGHFFYLLKSDNLNALLYSYQMTHYAFDRLRGHGIRQSAISRSLIAPNDKSRIQTVMDRYLKQHKLELNFWWESCMSLRTLYDVLVHIVDGYQVLLYQQRTGFAKSPIRINVEEMIKKELYTELIASFFNHLYQRRNPGFVSRGVEYVLNTFGSWYAHEVGAKDPRPFPELLAQATTEIQTDYETLAPYEETPPFAGRDKAFDFFEAVVNDHLAYAKQIAINGYQAKNFDLNWGEELRKLKDYKDLLKSLFFALDEFFKLEYRLAFKLTDTANPALGGAFEALDQAEYDAQQVRIDLMMSYQKSILGQLSKQNHLWGLLKERITDQVTRYLFKNEIFEKTPPFQDCSEMVRGRIHGYCQHISTVRGLLDPPAVPQADPGVQLKEGVSPGPPPLTSALGFSILMLAPERDIELIAHQAFSRFHSAEGYSAFVTNPQFERVKCIEAAIEFCRQNVSERALGWNWKEEIKELERYKRLVSRLDELSIAPSLATVAMVTPATNSAPNPIKRALTNERILEIRKQLIESFRKKVDTDYSETLRKGSQTWREAIENRAYLAKKSAYRKLLRGSYENPARDFRDPDFLRRFELDLGLDPMTFQPVGPSSSSLEEEWVFAAANEATNTEETKSLTADGKKPSSASLASSLPAVLPGSPPASPPVTLSSSLPTVSPSASPCTPPSYISRFMPVSLPSALSLSRPISLSESLPGWSSLPGWPGWLSRSHSNIPPSSQPATMSQPLSVGPHHPTESTPPPDSQQ